MSARKSSALPVAPLVDPVILKIQEPKVSPDEDLTSDEIDKQVCSLIA